MHIKREISLAKPIETMNCEGKKKNLVRVQRRQDYFTYFEPSQSLGGAKTGDPREETPDYPQAELGLSHM